MLKTFYVGVKGVVTASKKVLLLKKRDQDGKYFWDIPGGRIDGNETVSETLVRELKEEVPSIDTFRVGELLSAYRLEKDLKDGHGLCLLFYRIETEPFEVELSEEHSECRWFTLDELNSLHTEDCYISPGYLVAAKESLM